MERDHTSPPVDPSARITASSALLERIGRGTMHALRQGYELVGFLGRVTVETFGGDCSRRGANCRCPAFIHQIEETGVTALPIVGMLAFLLGIMLAYQGADQLKRFGAQIYTIDFLGVGFLRELGGLVTAIIIAGRSGSAFTAQIGTMRVNEEIDAMQTIGLNVAEILVLAARAGPRDRAATAHLLRRRRGHHRRHGDDLFRSRASPFPLSCANLQSAITVKTLLVGLIKAPVFAFVIALVGCFEGMRVERNADERRPADDALSGRIDLPDHRAGRCVFGPLFGAGDMMRGRHTQKTMSSSASAGW